MGDGRRMTKDKCKRKERFRSGTLEKKKSKGHGTEVFEFGM
jgi:hypothetical protein